MAPSKHLSAEERAAIRAAGERYSAALYGHPEAWRGFADMILDTLSQVTVRPGLKLTDEVPDWRKVPAASRLCDIDDRTEKLFPLWPE